MTKTNNIALSSKLKAYASTRGVVVEPFVVEIGSGILMRNLVRNQLTGSTAMLCSSMHDLDQLLDQLRFLKEPFV